jgi:hypothetical protein
MEGDIPVFYEEKQVDTESTMQDKVIVTQAQNLGTNHHNLGTTKVCLLSYLL